MSVTDEQHDGPESEQQSEEELSEEDLEDAAGGVFERRPEDRDSDDIPDSDDSMESPGDRARLH